MTRSAMLSLEISSDASWISLSKTIFSTVIWLSVNVPVLSEQIISTPPNVSTAGNLRTSALR